MEKAEITALFDKYIKKLRITPSWDVRLEFVEDPSWRKAGDFKIDCDDRKAILMLNAVNPTQENIEEVSFRRMREGKLKPYILQAIKTRSSDDHHIVIGVRPD